MKTTFFSLVRASVIILGSLALSLTFQMIHPILSILIIFSLWQIAEDTINNVKKISKLNHSYDDGLRTMMVSFYKKRIVIDILTTVGWFVIAAGAFVFSLYINS